MKKNTHQMLVDASDSDHSDHSTSQPDIINPFQVSSARPSETHNSLHKKTLDEVIEKIPVGWFHYRLLFICGLAFMADGLEVSLLAFISACGECVFSRTEMH